MTSKPSAMERFLVKVDQDGPVPDPSMCFRPVIGPCWMWTAAKDTKGYGRFWINEKVMSAQAAAYILFVGEIPAGLAPDHLCRIMLCVNPDHLEPVTAEENTRRTAGMRRRRVFDAQGHPLVPSNLTKGKRPRCRMCNSTASAASRRRRIDREKVAA